MSKKTATAILELLQTSHIGQGLIQEQERSAASARAELVRELDTVTRELGRELSRVDPAIEQAKAEIRRTEKAYNAAVASYSALYRERSSVTHAADVQARRIRAQLRDSADSRLMEFARELDRIEDATRNADDGEHVRKPSGKVYSRRPGKAARLRAIAAARAQVEDMLYLPHGDVASDIARIRAGLPEIGAAVEVDAFTGEPVHGARG
jgi:predicted phage tail protein